MAACFARGFDDRAGEKKKKHRNRGDGARRRYIRRRLRQQLHRGFAAPAKSPALTGRLQKQSNGWCAGYRFGQLSSAERLADPNRRRLLAAQSVLAPTFAAGKAKDGIALLANYQTEMELVRPDRVLAATYLALTSAQPINAKLVERVNGLLCVSASAKAAQGVAVIADAEWREMSR